MHLMIHLQPPAQENQQQPQPCKIHRDKMFEDGKALYQRLCLGSDKVYSEFRRLRVEKMMVQITSLQFWRETGGPQNYDDMVRSSMFLKKLNDIQKEISSSHSKDVWNSQIHRLDALATGLGFGITDQYNKELKQLSSQWIGPLAILIAWKFLQAIRCWVRRSR